MKQITPEIKQRIFALYWNQDIVWISNNEPRHKQRVCARTLKSAVFEHMKLGLTDLSSITDEDAIECGYSTCDDPNSGNYSMSPSGVFIDEIVEHNRPDMLNVHDVDYLRSKGYALPYTDWSVDELVEAGVFKIREVNND